MATTRVPGPADAGPRLSAQAWEALFRTQVAVMRRLAQDAIWDEVSMREYDVLFQVARAPGGRLRLRDLNERILLSQPSLSRLVERLEARGLVVRERAADDGRGVTVRLTEEGLAVQRRIGHRHVRTIHRVVGGTLAEDDLRALRDLCGRLLAAQPKLGEGDGLGGPRPASGTPDAPTEPEQP